VGSRPGAPNADGPSLFAKAEILLARGEWAEGWRNFEARWHTAEAWRTQKLHQTDLRSLPPEWDGVSTGRVLVCAEQGTGDTLMMLRYVRGPFVPQHDVEFRASVPAGARAVRSTYYAEYHRRAEWRARRG
jgi:hypothetical protein